MTEIRRLELATMFRRMAKTASAHSSRASQDTERAEYGGYARAMFLAAVLLEPVSEGKAK